MSIINNRFSIRNFEEKEIEREVLLEIVKSGMIAPSSKNKRPWQL